MQIVAERPPLWDEIVAAFPQAATMPGIIFAWGDRVYMPHGGELHAALQIHERVHMGRQGDVIPWWRRYMSDVDFRREEELLAHRAEFQYWADRPDAGEAVKGWRSAKDFYLFHIAARLASPLYGRMFYSVGAAKKAILAAA